MTDLRKAAEQALEALDSYPLPFQVPAKEALRQALAQPGRNCDNCESLRKAVFDRINELEDKLTEREWDGPTDEEYENFCSLLQRGEAKLKEKNCG